MTNPTVSIIIITRNRPDVLQHCLAHVQAQSYPHKQIIVIDSSSNDESEQVVAQYHGVISVRLHGQRNNMPQARNEGLAISSGELIAFIDDDAMVQPGWLDALLDTYRDETVGGVGGRIIEVPKPYCDLLTGSPCFSIRPSGRIIVKNKGTASTDQVEVDWLPGSNMSFRRTALEQVGGFDPAYTLTNWREDMDIGLRVQRAGWRIVFNPGMAEIHVSARSSDFHFEERPLTQFSIGRNGTYFAIKHFGLNPYTLTCQLLLAPAKTCGLTLYRIGLLSLGALAQTVGRDIGLVAGVHWLLSGRRRTQSAPELWSSSSSITVRPSYATLHKGETSSLLLEEEKIMTNPTVSIIIITRNRPNVLQHCLVHIQAQSYSHKQIIVVDSSSNDESERVTAQYPEVISVRLSVQRTIHENRPQARNEGLAISSGGLIAFIDDDAMVQPGWLDALLASYQDETVGAAGGRVIAMPKPFCDMITGSPVLAVRPSGQSIIENLGSFSTDQVEVDWLPGCNMSFRRTVLEQVGGFDPGLTFNNLRDDTDVCLRVQRAGWRVVFNPAMAVIHANAQHGRDFQERPFIQLAGGRNITYFAIKHFGLNPYTLACQLILAPARICGLTLYRIGLLSLGALAQTVGRDVGLIAGVHWLLSSRRRAESAPRLRPLDQST
jgi:GT2 family glycosyltransferase